MARRPHRDHRLFDAELELSLPNQFPVAARRQPGVDVVAREYDVTAKVEPPPVASAIGNRPQRRGKSGIALAANAPVKATQVNPGHS
jgi:hypothetical protein